MRRRVIAWIAVLAMASLGTPRAPEAADDDFAIIVHPGNPITAVDRDFVRDAFLKKRIDWASGVSIRPIDLPGSSRVRDRFTQSILRKSRVQLRSYWNQQIFSGKGVPPREAESVEDAIRFVLENPGAVGYVPAGFRAGGAKIVPVR
jgi:ABC-type phosphate transport system substrate-binding protein